VSCEDVQQRLSDAFLAREASAADDAAHLAACSACASHASELSVLARTLDRMQVPPLRPAALARCEAQALRVLRAQRAARAPAPLSGLGRDLFRGAALALLALPVAVGHALFVAWAGSSLLGPWLPGPVLTWLGVFYFAPVVLGLGVLYGAIPLAVAVGRRRPLEES
jgi:hypothetical protein